MIELRVDRRTRTYERDVSSLDRVGDLMRARREIDIALARALLHVQRTKTHYDVACGSVPMLGRKHGLTTFETVRLLRFARAMEADRSVEDRVRSGALSIPAAAELAGVLATLGPPEESSDVRDDWLEDAENVPYAETRRKARRYEAELRCGEAVDRVEVMVPDSVVERFERARVLASRKAKRQLSRDETFEVVVDSYVDAHDPLEVDERARRVGPTSELPDSRYIPVSVRRAVRRRAADGCEFPGCQERTHLEFAHRRPHWAGGSREAGNLLLLCRFHHFMQETRFLVPVGPLDDPLWFRGEEFVCSRSAPEERPPQGRRELRVAAVLARMRQAGVWDNSVEKWTEFADRPRCAATLLASAV